MHLCNFNTDKYKPGLILKGRFFVKERGIMMVPEVPVGRSFQRADGTLIKINKVDFETDVYTIAIYKDGKTHALASNSQQLVKKLIVENWRLIKE